MIERWNNKKKRQPHAAFFREDRFYALTLRQHATFALAFNAACNRVDTMGKKNPERESVLRCETFRKRYSRLLEQADMETRGVWEAEWRSLPGHDDLHTFRLSKIISHLKVLRTYFSCYGHDADSLRCVISDPPFRRFLSLLRDKAAVHWQNIHPEWQENIDKKEERPSYHQVNAYLWSSLERRFDVYRVDAAAVPLCDLLLFVGIFIPKSAMNRFLDRMDDLRETDDTHEEGTNVRHYRTALTALCLRETQTFQTQRGDLILLMTILDHFVRITGRRTNRKGTELFSPPRLPTEHALPDICARHSTPFFIRMLVGIIEEEELLPSLIFARSLNGRPSFCADDRNCELYIKHANVAVRIVPVTEERRLLPETGQKEGQDGVLGVHALKLIVLGWLLDKKTLCGPIRHIFSEADRTKGSGAPVLVDNTGKAFLSFSMDRVRKAADWKTALASRVADVERRHFRHDPKSRDHTKAMTILWWINRRLPDGEKLKKAAYQRAMCALERGYDLDAFIPCLPNLSVSAFALDGKTLRAWVRTATTLSDLYQNICHDYGEQKRHAAVSDEAMHRFARLIGLRCVQKENPAKSADRIVANLKSSSRQVSPPAHLLWQSYFPEYLQAISKARSFRQGRLPYGFLIEKAFSRLGGDEGFPMPNPALYGYHRPGTPSDALMFSDVAQEYYNRDLLLSLCVRKIAARYSLATDEDLVVNADFTYTVSVPLLTDAYGKNIRLKVCSSSARRSYISVHPQRLRCVAKNYLLPNRGGERAILFVIGHPEKRLPLAPPRSWLEAEDDMEYERFLMMKTLLAWEKEMVCSLSWANVQGNTYPDIDTLWDLCLPDDPYRQEYKVWRTQVFESVPEKAFNQAPGILGERFCAQRNKGNTTRREDKCMVRSRLYRKNIFRPGIVTKPMVSSGMS